MDNKMEVVAIPITELEPSKFMFSEKKSRTWSFVDDKGKPRAGSETYVEVYYDQPGQKLCFLMEDLKSFNGVQTGKNAKKGFMSLTLKADKSEQLKKYLETPIFHLSFQNRAALIKDHAKITQPAEMRIIFNGIITPGAEKPDGTGVWDDQMTCTVPMKKKGQQAVVDENLCTVEDLGGRPYAWSALDGKNLKEVCIEVEKVIYGPKIRIQGVYRLIVPEDMARAKVTTARRGVEQKKRPADHDSSPPVESAAAPVSSTSAANTSISTEKNEHKKARTMPVGSS